MGDQIIVQVKGDKSSAIVASTIPKKSFGEVNVTGQNNIVATVATDTLRVRPGTGIAITTNSINGTLTIAATGGSAFDQYARDTANLALNTATTLVTDNVPETTTNLYFTAARVRANISNTAPVNYDPSTGVISLAAPSLPGQLLVGNTISGSYDISNITPGFGISVTNSNGSVTISSFIGRDYYLILSQASDVSGYNVASTSASANSEQNTTTSLTGTSYSLISSFITPIGDPNINLLPSGTYGRHIHATTGSSSQDAQLRIDLYKRAANGLETLIRTSTSIVFNASNANDLTTWSVTDPNGYFLDVTDRLVWKVYGARVSGPATCALTVYYEGSTRTSYVSTTILESGGDTLARSQANAAFAQANAAYANANTAIYTATQIRANISNTTPINYSLTTGVISHADSGVTAKTYGNTTLIPQITVDSKGHVTSVSNVAITGLPSSTANGQVLIGNTVSGSFDVTTLTQGSGITITNGQGSITIATTGSAIDQFARDTANGAFAKANTANVTGQAAFNQANTANTVAASSYAQANIATTNADAAFARANAAYANANTAIYTATQIRANISNTAPINYDPTTGVVSHASSGVTATTYGNATFVSSVTVDARGHVTGASNTQIALPASQITSGTLSVARGGTGQTAITVNGAILIANTVSGAYDVNTLTQGSGISITNDKGSITIAATSSGIDQVARDTANGAFAQANGAFNKANAAVANSGVTTNGVLHIGNTVSGGFDLRTLTQGTGITITNGQGTITIAATGGSALDQFARDTANGAFATANGAFAQANGAFNKANAATPNTATANGQIYAGNTVSGTFDLTTIAQTAPVIVTNGRGTVTLSHASSGVTATTYGNASHIPTVTVDQFGHITVASNSKVAIAAAQITSGATVNGQMLIGNTVSGAFDVNTIAQTAPVIVTNGKGTVTLSHASSGVVATTYGNTLSVPQITVDQFGHVTVASNVTIDQTLAQTARDTANGAFAQANGAFNKANAAVANSGVTVNGSFHIGNTVSGGFDISTIAQTAPVIVTNGRGTVTLSHASSGVTATTYGNASHIPSVTVDQYGHITTSTNNKVAIAAAQITSGATANGQLLIGNTVSGAFDVATLTQGTGITVTNDKGSITIAATGGSAVDQFARDTANGAFTTANGAFAQANGAFNKANAATPNTATVNGQIYVGNTVSGKFDLTTLTQGTGIVITNGQGSITIAATGGSAVDQFARDTANGAFVQANIASNNWAFINTQSLAANTQGNLVAVGSDTIIMTAGAGMNISFSTVGGDQVVFASNPGYTQVIGSGGSLYTFWSF